MLHHSEPFPLLCTLSTRLGFLCCCNEPTSVTLISSKVDVIRESLFRKITSQNYFQVILKKMLCFSYFLGIQFRQQFAHHTMHSNIGSGLISPTTLLVQVEQSVVCMRGQHLKRSELWLKCLIMLVCPGTRSDLKVRIKVKFTRGKVAIGAVGVTSSVRFIFHLFYGSAVGHKSTLKSLARY